MRLQQTLDMIFSLLPSNIFQLDDKHLVAIGSTRFGPFTSLGKPEACRDYYLPGFTTAASPSSSRCSGRAVSDW